MFEQILAKLNGYVELIPYNEFVVPVVLAVLGLIVACNGKKLLNALKFIVCAGAGLVAGYMVATLETVAPVLASTLAPVTEKVAPVLASTGLQLDATGVVVGAVLAVVAAILCKILYPIAFAGACGYAAYTVLPIVAAKVPQLAVVTENILIVAIVVGVVALIFRGLIEMLGTAAAGGYVFTTAVESLLLAILALTGKVYANAFTPITVLLITAVIALIGFVKQVKNRHRF